MAAYKLFCKDYESKLEDIDYLIQQREDVQDEIRFKQKDRTNKADFVDIYKQKLQEEYNKENHIQKPRSSASKQKPKG